MLGALLEAVSRDPDDEYRETAKSVGGDHPRALPRVGWQDRIPA